MPLNIQDNPKQPGVAAIEEESSGAWAVTATAGNAVDSKRRSKRAMAGATNELVSFSSALSPAMVNLRNWAEALHVRWVSDDRDFVREKLNGVSRRDLGILCAVMVDCAHLYNRPHLTTWLERQLAVEVDQADTATTPPSPAPKLHYDRRREAARQAFALSRIPSLTAYSPRFRTLQELAMRLQSAWTGSERKTVRETLNGVNRAELGLLCALINERLNPLIRQNFANWLESELNCAPRSTKAVA